MSIFIIFFRRLAGWLGIFWVRFSCDFRGRVLGSMKVVPRLERKSSIENEPRTLNIRQIQIAREAALYVVSTRSMEEALRIFTEGLEPVLKCASGNNHEEEDGEEEQEDKNMELRHDCGYEEEFGSLSWDQSSRDIVTAPF